MKKTQILFIFLLACGDLLSQMEDNMFIRKTHLIYSNSDNELLYFLYKPQLRAFYSNGTKDFREVKIIRTENKGNSLIYFFEPSAPFNTLFVSGGLMDFDIINCNYGGTIKPFGESCSMDLFSKKEDIWLDPYIGFFYDTEENGFYIFTKNKKKELEISFLDSMTEIRTPLQITSLNSDDHIIREIIVQDKTGKKYFYTGFYENIRPNILKSSQKKTEEDLNRTFHGLELSYPYLESFPHFHQNYVDWNTHEIISLQINKGDTQVFYSNGNGHYQKLLLLSNNFLIYKDSFRIDLQLRLAVAFQNNPVKIYALNTIPRKEFGDISIECKNPDGARQNFVRFGEADTTILFSDIIRKN